MKTFIYTIIAFVVAVAILGFVLVGSPVGERARQFDMRRVNDLQQIQSQVTDYWQRTGNLPATLGEYQVDYRPLVDPESNALYEYYMTASTTFELCAVFTEESYVASSAYTTKKPIEGVSRPVPAPVGSELETWEHPAGRFCFVRAINPALYPPIPRAATGGCIVTGCSGQVCAETEVVTTCEFQPQYACYKQYSRCERQTSGQCGWSQTPALTQCLSSSKPVPIPS